MSAGRCWRHWADLLLKTPATANDKVASGAAQADVPQGIPAPNRANLARRSPPGTGHWRSVQLSGAARSRLPPPS